MVHSLKHLVEDLALNWYTIIIIWQRSIIIMMCFYQNKFQQDGREKTNTIYCKTTNFSMLLILAILANGIKTLILIPTNINTQPRGHT